MPDSVSIQAAWAEWNRSLDLLAEQTDGSMEDLVKERGAKLVKNLAYKTPYKSGRGKGGWLPAVKGLGARVYVGRRPNANGDYRENFTPAEKRIDLINSWKHLYMQNYGFTSVVRGKTITVTKHKGWFAAAIEDNAQYNMKHFYRGMRKRRSTWVL